MMHCSSNEVWRGTSPTESHTISKLCSCGTAHLPRFMWFARDPYSSLSLQAEAALIELDHGRGFQAGLCPISLAIFRPGSAFLMASLRWTPLGTATNRLFSNRNRKIPWIMFKCAGWNVWTQDSVRMSGSMIIAHILYCWLPGFSCRLHHCYLQIIYLSILICKMGIMMVASIT